MLDKSSPCGLEVHQSPGLELHVVIYRSVFLFVILFYIKYSHEFNNLPLSLVLCSHHRARENAQHLKNSLCATFCSSVIVYVSLEYLSVMVTTIMKNGSPKIKKKTFILVF